MVTQIFNDSDCIFQMTDPLERARGKYVGELQELWEFPSDHLPIGLSIDLVHLVSWNILDANYMGWVIDKNSQGLSRSKIADEHVYLGGSGLTIRDINIIEKVLAMIFHPTHPKNILALQEINPAVLSTLSSKLPAHFKLIAADGNAMIIDESVYEVMDSRNVQDVFSSDRCREIQDVLVCRRHDQQQMRLINAHLPGEPEGPSRFEFINYLANVFDPKVTMLALGDMNFNEVDMQKALHRGFGKHTPLQLYTPYCTNIAPVTFTSKAIDHFIIYAPYSKVDVNQPEEVLVGLEPFVNLLN